jgi:hypothetical protein
MKKTFALLMALVVLVGFSGISFAADQSWTGWVSDANCAKDYAKSSTEKHVACAKSCVAKGAKWALSMKDGMVILDVAPETAEKNLGHAVTVMGTLDKATNTVKVSSIEAAKN